MTEAEWLSSASPLSLLRHLGRKARTRKLRLFAVACCRRAWERMTDETCRQAVEVAERFADHQVSNRERKRATQAVRSLISRDGPFYFLLAYEVVRAPRFTFVRATTVTAYANFTVVGTQTVGENPAAEEAESAAQCRLLRDIYGNPFRPVALDPAWLAWGGGTVPELAQAIYDERAFARLPVLADALEEAGCADADLLGHCRQPAEHVRGCWVVDFLLGKS